MGSAPPIISESAKGFALVAIEELASIIGRPKTRRFLLQVASAL